MDDQNLIIEPEIKTDIITEKISNEIIHTEESQECNEFYEKNLNVLKEKHQHVYKMIKAYEEGTYKSKTSNFYEGIYLANNEFKKVVNIVIRKQNENYMVCDHNDPLKQSQEWLDKRVDENNKTEILFGLGMGFHIDLLMEKYPEKKLLIIEPSVELFIYLISSRDMTKIFNKCWILLEESFDIFLKNFLTLYWDARNKGIFKLQAINVYSVVFDTIWNEFREKFKKQMNALFVDTATRKKLTELWLNNYISNIKRINEASNADGFLGKFKGVPGILVSAGSSLEDNIHLVKDIKDKCLLLSASSARLSMKQHNISPHMFMTVDASDGETRIVDGIENDNEYMVYSNQLTPKSLEIYDGKKIFINYNSDFYTTNFLAWAGIKSGHVISAPSVANTCFDFLYRLGCNPIIFIGQDLAFTKNKQYAGKIDYGVDMPEEEFAKLGYVQVEDIHGNMVYTMPPFLAMRNCFEDQIRGAKLENPELEVINCTEGGLNLEGAKNEKLEDIISKYMSTDNKVDSNVVNDINVVNMIEELYQNSMFGDFTDKVTEFNKFLVTELDGLKNLTFKQKKMLNVIEKFKVTSKDRKDKFDKLLKETDYMSKMREESMIFKLLISPLLQVDLFQMGIKFVTENEHETNFEKKRRVYVGTLREQIKMIDEKIGWVRGMLEEKKLDTVVDVELS